MSDSRRTKAELVEELERLRARVPELERELEHCKRAEGALRESEERFRTLFENAPIGSYRTTPDGRILAANPALVRMLGYSSFEELATRNLEEEGFEPEYPRSEFIERIEREGAIVGREGAWKKRDGGVIFVRENARAIRDADGRITHYEGTVEDITKRKRAEERLLLLSSAVEQSTEGIAVADLDGNVLFTNQAFARMHGYAPEELLHQHLSVFHAREQMPAVEEILRDILEAGEFDGEVWHSRRDGHVFPTHMRNSLVRDDAGHPVAMIAAARDITEQKRVEEALLASEHRYRTFLESSHEVIFGKDRDWCYRTVNLRAAIGLGGTCIEDVEGKTDYDLLPKEQADALRRVDMQVMDSGEAMDVEEVVRDAQGEDRVYLCKKWPSHDENGQIDGINCFAMDITERKRAEAELRQAHDELERRVEERTADLTAANRRLQREIAERKRAEEQLELFLHCVESSADGIAMGSLDGRITYVNETFAGMLGYSKEELTGKEIAFVYAEDQIAKLKEVLKVTTKSGWTGELVARRKNGELFPMSVASSRVLDDEGRMIAYMASHQDITNRKRAEEALQESEKKHRVLVENLPQRIFYKDRDSVYLSCNDNYAKDLGIKPEEIVGRTDYEFFPKELAEKYRADDRKLMASGATEEIEEKYLHDGQELIVQTVKTPVKNENGDVIGVLGIFWDITDRKRAEKELRRAKEAAETANQAKGRFLANMSHEIRTPITAMLGAAELLTAADTERADHRHHSDIILRNGRHLLSLIDDLLDLSRAEAGKQEIQRTRCSLLDILADVRAVTEPLHHDEKVDFRILCEGAIPTHIHTDPTRLKQAVINLINNALKSTDAGHVYTRVSIDRADAEPRLTIAVEDTGVGISAKDIERIFDTFTQVDPTPSRIRSGVGLGLPLAKWIAQQLGGTLEVTSAKGRGSTFTLRVATGPLEDVDWVTPSEAVSPRPSSTVREHVAARVRLRGNILLAEDFRDVRDLISHRLIQAGAQVKAVHNGEEAVRAAVERDFDLILLDVRMPGMDGPTAAAELRRRGCLTPIIALTAATADNEGERIIAAGFDELWPKPMSLERLVERVANYVRADRDDIQNDVAAATPGSTRVTDDPRMASVVAEFSRNLPARLQKLRDLVDAGDLRQAREVLHQLVGVAGILGYMSLSDEAARVLAMIKDGSFSGADNLRPLEELVDEIARGLRNDQSVAGGDAP